MPEPIFSLTVPQCADNVRVLLTDLSAGRWAIMTNGKVIKRQTVKEQDGSWWISLTPGDYKIKQL